MERSGVLYTTGYEGLDLEGLISRLAKYGVDCVVDVRELPISRKRGFSKSSLRERLEEEGFQYIHMRRLGSPRDLRHKLRQDRDYQSFFNAFSSYLDNNDSALDEIHRYIATFTCCLLCYERLPQKCHRSIVAARIRQRDETGLEVIDI